MSQEKPKTEIDVHLEALRGGDRSALDRLTPLVYGEFRTIAAKLLSKERPGHTFQPSDLVNEAFVNQKIDSCLVTSGPPRQNIV